MRMRAHADRARGSRTWLALAAFARAKHLTPETDAASPLPPPPPHPLPLVTPSSRSDSWWDQILRTQAAAGVKVMTCEPEHGTNG